MPDARTQEDLPQAMEPRERSTAPRRGGEGFVAWLGAIGSTMMLSRSLEVIQSKAARSMAASIAIVYASFSMLLGGMLTFGPQYSATGPVTSVSAQVITEPFSPQWWVFPLVVVQGPNGILALPFFGTVAMIVVSIGVGIGMSVGMILTYRVLRERHQGLRGASAASTAAGLTPAMIALVTLGACCSTTAAATAGLGIVAQANGTTPDQLIVNSWYLGVFQMVVLGVALLAQEQLLSIFRDILPKSPGAGAESVALVHPGPRQLPPALLRFALLAGGVTWSLAMVAAWVGISPLTAGAGTWFFWIVEQLFVAVVAATVALSSREGLDLFAARLESSGAMALRVALLASGLCLLLWLPAPIAAQGPHGLVNELLWGAGAPASWGAVSPGDFAGLSLALRWVLQFGLLGTFSVVLALTPRRVLRLLNPPAVASLATPRESLSPSVPA